MILFWLICAGLVAIALAFILPTLMQRGAEDTAQAQNKEANLDVYRDQLSELEADLRNGIISSEQYQQDREEVERRLLDDLPTADETRKHVVHPRQIVRQSMPLPLVFRPCRRFVFSPG